MNKVMLFGRIGSDIELKYTPNGVAVANCSLATSKKINGQEKTSWHKLIFFKMGAENANKYLKKGDQFLVTDGEISYREYEKDGVKKYFTEILVNRFKFVSSGEKQQSQPQALQPNQAPTYDIPDTDFDSENLPF